MSTVAVLLMSCPSTSVISTITATSRVRTRVTEERAQPVGDELRGTGLLECRGERDHSPPRG